MAKLIALNGLLVLLAAYVRVLDARSAVVEQRGSMRGSTEARTFERDVGVAMGEVLGCGGQVDHAHLRQLENKLAPMWRTLPKNAEGNIDRRSLRYLVHRHFNRESALHIRGLEPSRAPSASGWGGDDILSQRVPAFMESVLESRHRIERGFTLADAAQMVAVFEQLIFDAEGSLLERVYLEQRKPQDRSLSRQGLEQLLESYMIHWMVGDDQDSVDYLIANRSALTAAIPHWTEIVDFTHGRAQALEFTRQALPIAAVKAGSAHNAFEQRYSFDDVHRVVGGITRSFASFWDSECSNMKAQLVEMDTHHTGRVPLSKFYGTGLDADWRFGESEAYLRELGALDETSWRGKQVIIPNYLQAASNCIVTADHYRVCCSNDCEILLDEIEAQIAAPTARPEVILGVIGNMTSADDAAPQIDASLTSQLRQIADAHNGEVPLHGRLFAQWLHYVFPRECPFPHKSGATAASSPMEFGEHYVASNEEMLRYAMEANASDIPESMGKEELQWMSQWSAEEELITDHVAAGLRAPWDRANVATGGVLLLVVAALAGAVGFGRKSNKSHDSLLPSYGKSHFV